MTIHLLVVGRYKAPLCAYNDRIGEAGAVAVETATFKMRYCDSPQDLVEIVRRVAVDSRHRIDILDLYDHGWSGGLRMGGLLKDVLFACDGTGLNIARDLRPFLTPDARVRLLGCGTALNLEGWLLLQMLRSALGGSIVVYGTIRGTAADTEKKLDFDENGFKKEMEDGCLFSSTEALSRTTPDQVTRSAEHSAWLATLSPPLEPHAPDTDRDVQIAIRSHLDPVEMLNGSAPHAA